jgi:hypothetical protein
MLAKRVLAAQDGGSWIRNTLKRALDKHLATLRNDGRLQVVCVCARACAGARVKADQR